MTQAYTIYTCLPFTRKRVLYGVFFEATVFYSCLMLDYVRVINFRIIIIIIIMCLKQLAFLI